MCVYVHTHSVTCVRACRVNYFLQNLYFLFVTCACYLVRTQIVLYIFAKIDKSEQLNKLSNTTEELFLLFCGYISTL